MVKKLITLGIAILLLFSVMGSTACDSNEIVETDYFRVELLKKERYAIVLELTELGKEQEILAVPMFVEGLPVKQIGRKIGGMWSGWYYIDGNNLKKLYIPHSVETIATGTEPASGNVIVVNLVDVPSGYFVNMRISTLVHLNYDNNNYVDQCSNVAFMYNYSDAPNQGYYWIDYVAGEDLYLLPPAPIRENHSFAGWYLEPACTTLWNEQMPQSADETLNLFAKWQEK